MNILQNKKKKYVDEEFKRIVVRKKVYEQLKNLGGAGDSFNDVLVKILAHQEGAYKIDVETNTTK
jgi:predicted CopG family antitoxin